MISSHKRGYIFATAAVTASCTAESVLPAACAIYLLSSFIANYSALDKFHLQKRCISKCDVLYGMTTLEQLFRSLLPIFWISAA